MSKVVQMKKRVSRIQPVRVTRSIEENEFHEFSAGMTRGAIVEEPEAFPGKPHPDFPTNSMETLLAERLEQERRFIRSEFERDWGEQIHQSEQRVGALLASISTAFDGLTETIERHVLDLALTIAKGVIKKEVTFDNEVVLRQIKEGLRRVVGIAHIRVRVHPDDEALIRQHKINLLAGSDALKEMVVEADDTVQRGGCVLESDSGNVDAQLATQLASIEAALRDE